MAQADLNHRLAQVSEGRFSDVEVHMYTVAQIGRCVHLHVTKVLFYRDIRIVTKIRKDMTISI